MGKKRFTDTGLYDKEWFQVLELKYKVFWEYLLKRCDHAGVWDVNLRLAGFQIGAEFDYKETLDAFGSRLVVITDDKWLINKFILFQYGGELNPANRVHSSVIDILAKYGIAMIEGVPSLVKKKKPRKEPKKTKRFQTPTLEQAAAYFSEKKHPKPKTEATRFWNYYESKGWLVGKHPMKNWKAAASGWMSRSSGDGDKKTYKQDGHGEDISW